MTVVVRSAVVLAVVLGASSLGRAADSAFERRIEFATPSLIGDVDGDGRPDLVGFAVYGPPELSIALGRADGTFGVPLEYTLGASSAPIAADVNLDGRTDLAYFTTAKLVVRLGAPGGLLPPIETTYVGLEMVVRKAADFDGDNAVDLLCTDKNFVVHLYRGDGLGNFQLASSLTQLGSLANAKVSDVENDGDLDVLDLLPSAKLSILKNAGAGVFQADDWVPPIWFSAIVDARDHDADGLGDLVVVSDGNIPPDSVPLTRLKNTSAGSNIQFQPQAFVALPFADFDAACEADLDDDGGRDLVLCGRSNVPLGTSSIVGNPRAVLVRSDPMPGGLAIAKDLAFVRSSRVGALDLDLDGALDLVASLLVSPGAAVVLDVLNHEQAPLATNTAAGLSTIYRSALADFDGDGIVDCVRRGATATELVLYRGDSHGKFGHPVVLATIPGAILEIEAVPGATALPDLLVSTSNQIWRVQKQAGGGYLAQNPATAFSSGPIAHADFDHDGQLDIATPDGSGKLAITFGAAVGFGAAATLVPKYSNAMAIAVGDPTGDGYSDLVTVEFVSGARVVVYANDGSGGLHYAFDAPTVPALGLFSARLAIGDFDSDGDDDAATFLSNGNGTYIPRIDVKHSTTSSFVDVQEIGEPQLSTLDFPPQGARPVVVDITGDGHLDLAYGGSVDSRVLTYYGRIDGRFDRGLSFALDATRDLDLADVDSDGRIDVIGSSPLVLEVALQNPNGLGCAVYGLGKPGTLGIPQLQATSAPQLNSEFGIRLSSACPNSPSILFLGTQAAAIPFDQGTLLVNPSFAFALPPTTAQGKLDIQALLHGVLGLCGVEIDMQVMLIDPLASGPLHTAQTNGLRVIFGI